MMMCHIPGCIAAATNGESCYIHATQQGKQCESCKGAGRRPHFDKRTGRLESYQPCDHCGATGLKDQRKGARRATSEPIDDRGLIQAAGEPADTPDAYDVALREARK
jgi:hypothetical protein